MFQLHWLMCSSLLTIIEEGGPIDDEVKTSKCNLMFLHTVPHIRVYLYSKPPSFFSHWIKIVDELFSRNFKHNMKIHAKSYTLQFSINVFNTQQPVVVSSLLNVHTTILHHSLNRHVKINTRYMLFSSYVLSSPLTVIVPAEKLPLMYVVSYRVDVQVTEKYDKWVIDDKVVIRFRTTCYGHKSKPNSFFFFLIRWFINRPKRTVDVYFLPAHRLLL